MRLCMHPGSLSHGVAAYDAVGGALMALFVLFDGLDGHDLVLLWLCAGVAALALLGIGLSALGECCSTPLPRPARPRGATRSDTLAASHPNRHSAA